MNKIWKRIVRLFRRKGSSALDTQPSRTVRELTLVVTGDFKQFQTWCKENGFVGPKQHQAIYIPHGRAQQVIYGLATLASNGSVLKSVVYTGAWDVRQDLDDIRDRIDTLTVLYGPVRTYRFEVR